MKSNLRPGFAVATCVWSTDLAMPRILLPVLCTLFIFSGCAGIGPSTVVPARFDYTTAIGDSWKQQMLINLVKIRYGDPPVFLDVASVISQYQIVAGANWSGTFNNQSSDNTHTLGATGNLADPVTGEVNWGGAFGSPFLSSSQNFGVTGGYADRPTITYLPLSGDKFTRTLMKPIPPSALLSLIQAGYPVDLVLRICTHSVNGVRNRCGAPARSRHADPDFYPLLERLRKIQDSGSMGLRVQKTGEYEAIMMSFRSRTADAQTEQDVAFVRKTLGLDPAGIEFRVVYGSSARDSGELAILTRSVLEILVDSASFIEVPSKHVDEKRVNPTMSEEAVAGVAVPSLIRIQSSRFLPDDTFIAVPYRNHWFWIDDRDIRSKTMFSFLMFIFSLTDTEGKQGAPVITIPSG